MTPNPCTRASAPKHVFTSVSRNDNDPFGICLSERAAHGGKLNVKKVHFENIDASFQKNKHMHYKTCMFGRSLGFCSFFFAPPKKKVTQTEKKGSVSRNPCFEIGPINWPRGPIATVKEAQEEDPFRVLEEANGPKASGPPCIFHDGSPLPPRSSTWFAALGI